MGPEAGVPGLLSSEPGKWPALSAPSPAFPFSARLKMERGLRALRRPGRRSLLTPAPLRPAPVGLGSPDPREAEARQDLLPRAPPPGHLSIPRAGVEGTVAVASAGRRPAGWPRLASGLAWPWLLFPPEWGCDSPSGGMTGGDKIWEIVALPRRPNLVPRQGIGSEGR